MRPVREREDRNVVPRWRTVEATIRAREGESQEVATTSEFANTRAEAEVTLLSEQWAENRSIGLATDLVSLAYVSATPELAVDACTYLLGQTEVISPELVRVASLILGQGEPAVASETESAVSVEELRLGIRANKARLTAAPRNLLVWLDLARGYMSLGQAEKAERALQVALNLSPDHRLTLRAATRFYLHQDNPEAAAQLLRKNARTREDPWLLAAEVAASTLWGRPPTFTRDAKRLLDSNNLTPLSYSELAAGLGTLEAAHGQDKRAKRLFRVALRDPSDNSVAQAEWLERVHQISTGHQQHLSNPFTNEARAWEHYVNSRFNEAKNEAIKWLRDEPYSFRAAGFAAFLDELTSTNPQDAVVIIRRSAEANPSNAMVLNDISYYLAVTGDIGEAHRQFSRIDESRLDGRGRVFWHATAGLLAFREGEPGFARESYQRAIELARVLGLSELEAIAYYNLAREEALAGEAQRSERALAACDEHLKERPSPGLFHLVSRLRGEAP